MTLNLEGIEPSEPCASRMHVRGTCGCIAILRKDDKLCIVKLPDGQERTGSWEMILSYLKHHVTQNICAKCGALAEGHYQAGHMFEPVTR